MVYKLLQDEIYRFRKMQSIAEPWPIVIGFISEVRALSHSFLYLSTYHGTYHSPSLLSFQFIFLLIRRLHLFVLSLFLSYQSFAAIAEHPRMLNLLEDFLGPDIAFNPVWNLRTKTPNNLATVVPWHQGDYFNLFLRVLCW